MTDKILVLGGDGMLGQMAYRYFKSAGFDTIRHTARFDVSSSTCYIREINFYKSDVVINCIGLIKQYSKNKNTYYDINARLPGLLAMGLTRSTLLIHPSSDCVYQGNIKGSYHESMPHDADDDYGLSKSMGELSTLYRPNTLIIRTSVIGPDVRPTAPGLMAWLMRHSQGDLVNGYTNHFWNGITTLEWCKVAHNLLAQVKDYTKARVVVPSLKQVITKYELLNYINLVYDIKLKIYPVQNESYINRSLIPNYNVSCIVDQLTECLQFVNTRQLNS